ncbi:LysM peptidoglycan-binding domain-containing protein [Aspergillus melleus]|uniref:LysM peptidoglycan-binding domain-containing protein n=1 Tax=Aspergillus melleus TaxID=138277 RepID=UPI001E8CE0B2|nr:uncharacterized protein LDX57_010415 [Aspergillus melleus]KAH8432788.1 hypothetical protein LDX57_010415 [Aspergillus melleus]
MVAADGLLSAECEAAMTAPIACSTYFRAGVDETRSKEAMDMSSICTDTCEQSLAQYHDSVLSACQDYPDPWPGVPATAYGDGIWINYNYVCGKGPVVQLDDCTYSMQKMKTILICTDLDGYDFDDYDDPSDEPATSPYVILDPFLPVPTLSAKEGSQNTDSPDDLTVQHNPKREIVRNNSKRDWSTDAAVCQQHTVQSGDTCWRIANTYRVTLAQLRAWNSFINAECTNLIIGDQICVSEPASGNSTVTTPTQATSTMSTPYATATVAPPGPVARGTTTKCGR